MGCACYEAAAGEGIIMVRQKKREIRKIVDALLKAIPERGTPEFQRLLEEIPQLSMTNCWCHEYEMAKYLTETRLFSGFGTTRVQK